MNDETFEQNFTWYEWSFVGVGDVPTDDLSVRSSECAGRAEVSGHSWSGSSVPVTWDDRPWTT